MNGCYCCPDRLHCCTRTMIASLAWPTICRGAIDANVMVSRSLNSPDIVAVRIQVRVKSIYVHVGIYSDGIHRVSNEMNSIDAPKPIGYCRMCSRCSHYYYPAVRRSLTFYSFCKIVRIAFCGRWAVVSDPYYLSFCNAEAGDGGAAAAAKRSSQQGFSFVSHRNRQ